MDRDTGDGAIADCRDILDGLGGWTKGCFEPPWPNSPSRHGSDWKRYNYPMAPCKDMKCARGQHYRFQREHGLYQKGYNYYYLGKITDTVRPHYIIDGVYMEECP